MACEDQISTQSLENAETNAITLGEVATSRAGAMSTGDIIDTATNMFGETTDTVTGRLKKMGFAVPVVYAGGISFTINDNVKTVDEGGIISAPLPSALPFTTSGTWVGDDEDKFFTVQGLTNDQLINDRSQAHEFDTVADMTSSVISFPVGKILETVFYNVDIKQSWEVVAAIGADQYGVAIGITGLFAQLIPRELGVSPSDFGAGRDDADYSAEIQQCFDYCDVNEHPCTGHGTYYTAFSVYLNTNFESLGGMLIEPTTDFEDTALAIENGGAVDFDLMERRVIILDTPNAQVRNLQARNGNGVPDLVGMDYGQHQIKSWHSGGNGFRVNNLVRDFSISIYEGRGNNGGANGNGLIAYAPNFSNEINALNIYGGEWFGNNGSSMNIGDTEGLFTTTLGPNDYMGNGVKLTGFPTLDQGTLKVDQVINFEGEIYCENGGAGLEVAVEVGGAAENSVRGFKISGYARDFDYYVKCLSGVSGIQMTNCFSRTINKCALYLTTDQYPYVYQNNTELNSFSEGQEVHTGARAGLTSNFWEGATIDVYGLSQGVPSGKANNHIYPNLHEKNGRDSLKYNLLRFRNYKDNLTLSSGSITGSTFTFDAPVEVVNFNGGDAINVSGGTQNTYIRQVDYDNGTVILDNAGTSGVTTIEQRTTTPNWEGFAFEAPTDTTSYALGSIVWNRFTVTQSPDGWILKAAGWTAMS